MNAEHHRPPRLGNGEATRCHTARFNWTSRNLGSALYVQLSGELDLKAVPVAAAALRDALSRRRTTVILDMTDVSFIDSSGLSLLIKTKNEVEAQLGRLLVSRRSPAVKQLVDVTGLNAWFDPVDCHRFVDQICPICHEPATRQAQSCASCHGAL